ncbi:MAG: acyl-ACP--UDP-N-acetylglucosamine O-acyltransferase [Planctomycetota bacterium]
MTPPKIHPTAVIDPSAEIDPSAQIGPYAVIDGKVRIGPRVRVWPHVYLTGWTTIESDCRIHPGAVVGHLPQDASYEGGESHCHIGQGTVMREGATVHRGTRPGSSTVVGKRCFLMTNSHVGHNCRVGDDTTIVNNVLLAGHVEIGSGAYLGGQVAVHQFTRIGDLAMVGGCTKVTQDIPPFLMMDVRAGCVGINSVGLRRAGFSPAEIEDAKLAYRLLCRSGYGIREATQKIAEQARTSAGQRIVAFLRGESRRGIQLRDKRRPEEAS